MSRPPVAKEKIIAAYVAMICDEGERAATMEATAALAGVSKGGLLYHFPSKESLAQAIIDGLHDLVAIDLENMASSPEGPSRYFVRTSCIIGGEFDRFFNAVLRLAQGGHAPALKALDAIQNSWLELIRGEVADEHAAEAIMLIGEGLYYQTSMPNAWYRRTFGDVLEDLLLQVDRLKAER